MDKIAEIKKRTVRPDYSILSCLKKMDEIDKKLLIVVDDKKFGGLLSIGDIQRAIINQEIK